MKYIMPMLTLVLIGNSYTAQAERIRQVAEKSSAKKPCKKSNDNKKCDQRVFDGIPVDSVKFTCKKSDTTIRDISGTYNGKTFCSGVDNLGTFVEIDSGPWYLKHDPETNRLLAFEEGFGGVYYNGILTEGRNAEGNRELGLWLHPVTVEATCWHESTRYQLIETKKCGITIQGSATIAGLFEGANFTETCRDRLDRISTVVPPEIFEGFDFFECAPQA